MNKKKLWIVIAAVLALAVLAGAMTLLYLKLRPEAVDGSKSFTVTVVHKDGSEKDFTFTSEEEYLGAVLIENGLIEGEEGPYGIMISAVDGETADWNVDQSYWALFIGDEYATTGVDMTPIHDGDAFRLVYTIG